MKKEITKKAPDYYIGVGLCFGVAFGALYDNIGLGIVRFGFWSSLATKRKEKNI